MEKFLDRIPAVLSAVADSPLALSGLALLLLAWGIITYQRRQLGLDTKNVAALPEKDRLTYLQDRRNISNLPSNISAGQWLAARRQLYLFLGYGFTLIMALLLAALILTAKGDQKFRVSINALLPAASEGPWGEKSADFVTYFAQEVDGTLHLGWKSKYLDNENRIAVNPDASPDPKETVRPGITINAQNNSSSIQTITGIRIVPKRVQPNQEPFPFLHLSYTDTALYAANLVHAPWYNPKIRFYLVKPSELRSSIDYAGKLIHEALPMDSHHSVVWPFDPCRYGFDASTKEYEFVGAPIPLGILPKLNTTTVDEILDSYHGRGFVERLNAVDNLYGHVTPALRFSELKNFLDMKFRAPAYTSENGSYGSIMFEVGMHGEFLYDVYNGEHRRFPFRTKFTCLPSPEHSPSFASATYGVCLDSAQPMPALVPVSHVIKAGETDRIDLRIASTRSAKFVLDIQVLGIYGRVIGERSVVYDALRFVDDLAIHEFPDRDEGSHTYKSNDPIGRC